MTKESRKKLGISQHIMAIHLGISRSQLAMIESGRREPNQKTLLAISKLDRLCNEAMLKARENDASADFLKKDDGSHMKFVATEIRKYGYKLAVTKRSLERLVAKQDNVQLSVEVLNNLSISKGKKDEPLSVAKQNARILQKSYTQTLLQLNTQLCGLEAMLTFLKAQI